MKDEKGAAHKSRNNRGLLIGSLVLVGLLAVGQLLGGGEDERPSTRLGTGGQSDTDTGEPDSPPPPTRTPTPVVESTYSPDDLASRIDEVLGESNRDMNNGRKLTDVDYRADEGSISVTWAADDNFSSSLIVAGIEGDAADILRVIDESRLPYNSVFLAATFALQDAAGNPSESEVVLASYGRATIERTDWGTFLSSRALDIANRYQIAPVLSD